MVANINEQLWIDFGLDIAIFLAELAYWIKKNAANNRHFYDGRYWSYNSYAAFTKMFPGWKIETIRRIIRNCVKHGLILIGNYNKKTYDNTNWYTLTEKAMQYFPFMSGLLLNTPVDSNIPPVETNRPIPKQLPTSNINITTSVSDETNNSKSVSNEEILDAYHEHLPELTKIKVVDRNLNNKIKSMKKNWPKYQKEGKAFTLELFIDFLKFVRAHHSWFLKPYTTESGNLRKNSLRNLIADINLARFANGEFSAS